MNRDTCNLNLFYVGNQQYNIDSFMNTFNQEMKSLFKVIDLDGLLNLWGGGGGRGRGAHTCFSLLHIFPNAMAEICIFL